MNLRFYLLLTTLLALPFAIRKIFLVENVPFFKEYEDISLYLFEIFLIGYVILSILEHKYYIKSIYKRVFHVEHLLIVLLAFLSTLLAAFFEDRYYGLYFVLRWSFYALFAFFLYKDFALIVPRGTIGSTNGTNCSTWNNPLLKFWHKLFHVEQFGVYLEHIVPPCLPAGRRGTLLGGKNCSTWNILQNILLLSLFLQSIIIIFQIYWQRSTGLFYLGEPILDTSIAGVATIIVDNTEFLRGYGTFLHPNITAFFFFVYGIAYILLSIVPRGTIEDENTKNCSTWNILYRKSLEKLQKLFHPASNAWSVAPAGWVEHSGTKKSKYMTQIVPRGTLFIVYMIVLVAFFLTFSKSVIGIALFIGLLCLFSQIVPRGTIVAIVVILGIFLFLDRGIPDFIDQSILERKIQYLSIPVSSPVELLVGQGLGSYVEILAQKSPGLYQWQLQPIHNTYVLWVFELGLLPLLGISVYLWQKCKKYRRYQHRKNLSGIQKIVLLVAGGMILLLAVDHYTWDIEQGQFLFVFLMTVLLFTFNSALPKNRE